MVTKEDEYIADVSKIGGFALIAPFAKEMLKVPYIELFEIPTSHLIYMFLTLLLACIGMHMIFKGKEILREERD